MTTGGCILEEVRFSQRCGCDPKLRLHAPSLMKSASHPSASHHVIVPRSSVDLWVYKLFPAILTRRQTADCCKTLNWIRAPHHKRLQTEILQLKMIVERGTFKSTYIETKCTHHLLPTSSQTSIPPPASPHHRHQQYHPCCPCALAPSSDEHPQPQQPSS